MSMAEWFARLLKRDAEHYICTTIPPQNTDIPVERKPLRAEQSYVRLWLAEMFLKDDRVLFREFVPVVHTSVRLTFGDKPSQELPYIAGPQNIGLGTTLGVGVQLNHALTNQLPYRGGLIEVAAGLLAYKKKDFFQSFSEVLHDVTGILKVGQLSTVLAVADVAIDGIQNLIGATDKNVHLLYFQGFGGSADDGGSELTSGYTAIIRATEKQLTTANLYVAGDRLRYGGSSESAKPLEGYDYMLLKAEVSETRNDLINFNVFQDLLKNAIREGIRDRAAGEAIVRTAATVAWACPDLIMADRLRVATIIKDVFDRHVPASLPAPPSGADLKAEIEALLESPMQVEAAASRLSASLSASATLDNFLERVL